MTLSNWGQEMAKRFNLPKYVVNENKQCVILVNEKGQQKNFYPYLWDNKKTVADWLGNPINETVVAELTNGFKLKLKQDETGNFLEVPEWAMPHLIGKGGRAINAAKQALQCDIKLRPYVSTQPAGVIAKWLI